MPSILFDIGHPAHVHLFKNARRILIERGFKVHVLARHKEVTHQLLDAYKIEYIPGSRKRNGILRLLELFEWFYLAVKVIRTHHIDLVASIGSPSSAWAAKVNNIPHLAFNDTETSILQRLLYRPATLKIFTPECLLKDYGPKQVRYRGTHDLAYLRPEWFSPDFSVKEEMGIGREDKYAIVRFVSWEATHDWIKKKSGFDIQSEIVSFISNHMRVFISGEKNLPEEFNKHMLRIPPHRLHDALAFADIVVGDGSTTLTEAAALGRPSVYISPFADLFGVVNFYRDYGLLEAYTSVDQGLKAVQAMINNPGTEQRARNRDKMLSSTIDVAQFVAGQCEQYTRKT